MVVFRFVFLLLSCILLLTGCWDRKEVNDLAFVLGTGFDKLDKNKYRTSVQVPLPGNSGQSGSSSGGGGAGGSAPYYVDSGQGRNIRESNDDLQSRMSRELFFSHRRIIIFGEELARNGFHDSLDVIIEQPQSRLSSSVFVTEGKAMDILNSTPHFEQFSSETIRELAKGGVRRSVKELINDIYNPGIDPILPIVSKSMTQNNDEENKKEEIEISRLAVFKDDQLGFFASTEESKGIKWIISEMDDQTYTYPVKDTKEMNIRVTNEKLKINHTVKNNLPKFTITINLEARVEQNEADLDFDNPSEYELAINKLESSIKKEVTSILNRSQEEGIDIAGLGYHLYQSDSLTWDKYWADDWRTILKDTEITTKINAEIIRNTSPGITIKE
ncbi:Ger(x)C family spore germination protein [Aquibacillus salsiterrae]|uniref:Ger(X)C family spore germination protein n=1 Tax=Aquibacillus salsiterrae TaxID=2950439 RepID=A0A9X3WCI8_9BACI|nr:Ger(x)C family spore germination protein [Aquibacillus salsiterrae]MDC3417317.1 Ger(x)C family spore germination protein [Aquibacillus salsiterrae]